MKKLYRSKKDKKIAGVCGGLGEYLNVDSTIIRLLLIFLTLATGLVPFLLTYLIGWAIIPFEEEKEES